MDNDEKFKSYKSTLPGILGVLDTTVSKIESVMLAGSIILMALNVMANVVGRYVFHQSLFFSEEVNRILIIFVTFAGIGYAARHGRHIRMSAFFDMVPVRMRKSFMIIICIITSLMMFFLTWFSIQYVFFNVAPKGRVLSALQIPLYWAYVFVPIGFLIAGIQYALTAIKNVTEKEVYLSTHVVDGYDEDELVR